MKRKFFLIIVFMFTTAGFFKSDLEECTDALIPMFFIVQDTEWKSVDKNENELARDEAKMKRIRNSCPSSGCSVSDDIEIIRLGRTFKSVKVRDVPKSEQLRKFKKFLKQNLKKKLQNENYEGQYKTCIYQKKKNPELFEAKYD